jgi:hypothetical protein
MAVPLNCWDLGHHEHGAKYTWHTSDVSANDQPSHSIFTMACVIIGNLTQPAPHIWQPFTINIYSQSYTNSKGHITANEYSVEKGKVIKRSLIQSLEAY